jgi:predicted Zn-dependent protease
MMDEYRSAAKYWRKYLESDPHNLEVTTSLMLAYLHRDEYAKAIQTVRDHIVGDTNLIVIYTTLGDYFRSQHKPFDADNAYEKVIELASKLQNPSRRMKEYLQQAQKRIESR